jgi:hypothetical protein
MLNLAMRRPQLGHDSQASARRRRSSSSSLLPGVPLRSRCITASASSIQRM